MFKNNDSIGKTFFVMIAVCLVCSVIVATAAVQLRPLQVQNQLLDFQINLLKTAGLDSTGNVSETFNRHIETRYVELDSGNFTEVDDNFDYRKAMKDPATSRVLSAEEDVASIRTRANVSPVYLAYADGVDSGKLSFVILPVHGYGLWSTMYGFVALQPDGKTLASFSYYEHAETPGLGGEISNPRWQALFPGKLITDDNGKPTLAIVKPGNASSQYEVDGLSGATLTSNGVQNTYTFWMGDNGFGPFLAKLRKGELK